MGYYGRFGFKSYGHSNLGSRFCFRCDKPLTDAASLNEGIGPICRKFDNAVLARLIPSNLPKALANYKLIDPLSLAPETVAAFVELETALTDPAAAERDDWRKEVKRVEWMLSFPQKHENTERLKDFVLALGYVGIVAIWNGEAATGKASVTFYLYRLHVTGPKNKAARFALKKIPGSKFHAATPTSKPSWSAPASEFEAFRLAVCKHYPNYEGLDEAIKEAKESLLHNDLTINPDGSIPMHPSTPPKQAVSIVNAGSAVKVKTPYNPDFIGELKGAIPHGSRKWDVIEKVWIVDIGFKSQVREIVAKHFPV